MGGLCTVVAMSTPQDIETDQDKPRVRRGAGMALMTGMALGMQEVFQPKPEQAAIVIEVSTPDPRDQAMDVDLNSAGGPVVTFRPWLAKPGDKGTTAGGAPAA